MIKKGKRKLKYRGSSVVDRSMHESKGRKRLGSIYQCLDKRFFVKEREKVDEIYRFLTFTKTAFGTEKRRKKKKMLAKRTVTFCNNPKVFTQKLSQLLFVNENSSGCQIIELNPDYSIIAKF